MVLLGEEIIINNNKYILSFRDDGRPSLKTYDEENKIWVILNFTLEETDTSEQIIKMLSEEFIKKVAFS